MYQFRTNVCTKRRCRNPAKCFDAHSKIMKRRVPNLNENGLFNYIPEVCPQWKKEKKCNLGDMCLRSHGWLERIFHPLLYKTKICKSSHKNGICPEYGAYCAFAQNPGEIRNLVEIYGESWKQHYDLSEREKKSPLGSNLCEVYHQDKTNYMANSTYPRHLEERVRANWEEPAESPTMIFSSPSLLGAGNISDILPNFHLDDQVTSYVQLYSDNVAGGSKHVTFNNSESRLPALSLDQSSSTSNFGRPSQDDGKSFYNHDSACYVENKSSREEYQIATVENKVSGVDKENEKASDQACQEHSLFSHFNFGYE